MLETRRKRQCRLDGHCESIADICAWVDDLMADYNYPQRDRFHVELALGEALTNAVKHGNGNNSDAGVRLEVDVQRDEIRLRIEDGGRGFNHRRLADPTDDAHIDLPHGRGVFLMREFMTRVCFNEAGNAVTMWKRRSTPV